MTQRTPQLTEEQINIIRNYSIADTGPETMARLCDMALASLRPTPGNSEAVREAIEKEIGK